MAPNEVKNKIIRLNKYLEQVQKNIKNTAGASKEFWEREHKKTYVTITRIT